MTQSWPIFLLNSAAAIALGLVIICRINKKAKFYIKTFGVYVALLYSAFITLPYGLCHFTDHRRNALFSGWLLKPLNKAYGIKWSFSFDRPVDKTRGHVIMCNHQSVLDIMGMMQIWPHIGHAVAMAKKELLYTGFFGMSLYLCGTLFVDRSSSRGREQMNEAGKLAKKTGKSMWVFPEGTRNPKHDGSLLEFKKGAFHVAIDSGMPILPVVVSEYEFLDHNRKVFEEGEARVRFLEPIETTGYTKETIDALIAKTRNAMLEALRADRDSKKEN